MAVCESTLALVGSFFRLAFLHGLNVGGVEPLETSPIRGGHPDAQSQAILHVFARQNFSPAIEPGKQCALFMTKPDVAGHMIPVKSPFNESQQRIAAFTRDRGA